MMRSGCRLMRELTVILEDSGEIFQVTRSVGVQMGDVYEAFRCAALAMGFHPDIVAEYFEERE